MNRIHSGVLCYDVVENLWIEEFDSLPFGRGFMISEVINNEIYIFGGLGDYVKTYLENCLDIYAPLTQDWSQVKPFPFGLYASSSCVLGNDIFVIGGTVGSDHNVAITRKYNVVLDSWDQLALPPLPLIFSGSAIIKDDIYVVGGVANHYDYPINKVLKYNISSNTWSMDLAEMPVAISEAAVCAYRGFLYVFGGRFSPLRSESLSEASSGVYLYDPITDFWFHLSEMPLGLECLTVHEIQGKMYLLGGYNLQSSEQQDLSVDQSPMSVYQPIKEPIYSLKTSIGRPALLIDQDSSQILAEIINHHNYDIQVIAQMTGQTTNKSFEITLYDDGTHGDGTQSDGLYGNFIPYPGFEDIFDLKIISRNLDLKEQFVSGQDCRPFCTIGPIEVVDYSVAKQLTNSKHERLISFHMQLKNSGKLIVVNDISVELYSDMDLIKLDTMTASVESIPPGKTVSCETEFTIRASENFPFPGLAKIYVSISSQGYSYWNQTIDIPVK